jgi:adenylate cyclase, class 2
VIDWRLCIFLDLKLNKIHRIKNNNMPFNVEVKVKYAHLEAVEKTLLAHNARFVGTDHQTDKYYNVPNGRLKIRRGNIENQLIFYRRNESADLKQSEIVLLPIDDKLEFVLDNILSTSVVVKKARKIFFINNAKFHLDEVEGLGRFVEIEIIDSMGTLPKEELAADCEKYVELLDLRNGGEFVPQSYSDLLR